ncbi:MAG: transglutaminase family protein [Chloroflexi bacterium]|nr:transglutaminase family protein [Chloroflexota bacterium]
MAKIPQFSALSAPIHFFPARLLPASVPTALILSALIPVRPTFCAAAQKVMRDDATHAAFHALAVRPSATLTTQFTYRAAVPAITAGARALDLWLPVPSDSRWQSVKGLTISSPVPYRITTEPTFGNRMVYVHRVRRPGEKTLAPLVMVVRFVVTRRPVQVLSAGSGGQNAREAASGKARADSLAGRQALVSLLKPDRLVPVGGRYTTMARTVAGPEKSPLQQMRDFFNHVVATMQYDYKHDSPRMGEGDAAFVCDYKKGNCSDLHSYLVSLARSAGIPCYLEFGFPITGVPVANPIPADGKVSGYHCWIWFHDPTHGWVPLDAADARRWLDHHQPAMKDYLFGSLVTPRTAVAVSRGRDIVLQPRQKGAPSTISFILMRKPTARP